VFGKPRLQAAQRAAGADADHDGVDIAVKLFIQFRCRGGAVRQRVGFVIELVDVKRAGQFVRQALGVILIIGRMALVDVGTVSTTWAPSARRWKIFSRLILSGTTRISE
jgi:hypothetical protein